MSGKVQLKWQQLCFWKNPLSDIVIRLYVYEETHYYYTAARLTELGSV